MYKNLFTYSNLKDLYLLTRPGTYKLQVASMAKEPRLAASQSMYYKFFIKAISFDNYKKLEQDLLDTGGSLDYNFVKEKYFTKAYIFEDNPAYNLFPLFRGDIINAVIERDEEDNTFKCIYIKSVEDAMIPDRIRPEYTSKFVDSINKLIN